MTYQVFMTNRRTLLATTIIVLLGAAVYLVIEQLVFPLLAPAQPQLYSVIIAILIAFAAVIALLSNLNDATDFISKLRGHSVITLKPEHERRLRGALIEKVRAIWINGLLKNSLQEAVWKIELGFE